MEEEKKIKLELEFSIEEFFLNEKKEFLTNALSDALEKSKTSMFEVISYYISQSSFKVLVEKFLEENKEVLLEKVAKAFNEVKIDWYDFEYTKKQAIDFVVEKNKDRLIKKADATIDSLCDMRIEDFYQEIKYRLCERIADSTIEDFLNKNKKG